MTQQGQPPQEKGLSPKAYLWTALFLYAGGAVLFFYLAHLESVGGVFDGDAAVVLLYRLGGKWLIAAFCGVVGTGFLIAAIRGWRDPRD